jgi:hypothetical protein
MSSSNRPVKSSSSPVLSVSGQQGAGAAATNQMSGQRGCLPGMRGPGPWGRMVDGIASRLAFFPPTPPSYTVEEHRDATGQLYIQPVERWVWRPASATSAQNLICIHSLQLSVLRCTGMWLVAPNSSSKLHAAHDAADAFCVLVVFANANDCQHYMPASYA